MKNKDEKTSNYYRSYVRIPRFVINRLFSDKIYERIQGNLLAIFYTFCSFRESDYICNGKSLILRKGEWITDYNELEKLTGCKREQLRYNLKRLRMEGSIEIQSLRPLMRIYIVHYEELDHFGTEERQSQSSTNKPKSSKTSRYAPPADTPPVRPEPASAEQQAIIDNAGLLKKPDLNAFKRRDADANAKKKLSPKTADPQKQTDSARTGTATTGNLLSDMKQALSEKQALEKKNNKPQV